MGRPSLPKLKCLPSGCYFYSVGGMIRLTFTFLCFTEITYCFFHGSLDKGWVFIPPAGGICPMLIKISTWWDSAVCSCSFTVNKLQGLIDFFLLLFNIETAEYFSRCWLFVAGQISGISLTLTTTWNHKLMKKKRNIPVNVKRSIGNSNHT